MLTELERYLLLREFPTATVNAWDELLKASHDDVKETLKRAIFHWIQMEIECP